MSTQTSADTAPQCEHWILGNIRVEERDGLTHNYERAILVTFKTVDEYRAALRFMSPIFDSSSSNTGETK
jgi:hypothetical protein